MRFLEGPPGFQGEGQKWVLIVGGALLSTLSNRLGYKLKQEVENPLTEKVEEPDFSFKCILFFPQLGWLLRSSSRIRLQNFRTLLTFSFCILPICNCCWMLQTWICLIPKGKYRD
ncbi:uncharacterized protein LOC111397053 isoform X3 [Olea europaea var. sylvestris]|uniref:uncharacterized protein LOC111397053 isoform X3 n=1 Tax=Olea europaea var. sylvestris TaxID=158386 RepID=UPI000C1D1FFF|nr:uncharacterized protein LOC111397053 isoform X3 [Olea europaea var. sylvestris]